ncbi:2,3-diaminopropionate biosynthesis protein SbnA [Cyclobacterium sp.]|uniref:2,3-diaminopropionate biosynthesis protein SbnA n=1 Tax=Cyclobacterium sp. TaxID=1966343 RepID=UPI0019A3AE62|nr:2,3-diaminopropionate biosynthesis protein SbnA [Cyclobacterium sp.]MBD3627830.1 2,3-diaminopropionate biosynthesis protein SbnA [Cyclobacterium sp.]
MTTIEKASGILVSVGNTPALRLEQLFPQSDHEFFAKLEHMNPGGSIKDRSSIFILQEAINLGKVSPDTVIIESTSGNMGIGLAQACLYLGLKLVLVVDPLINPHTENLLKIYGATLVKVQDKDSTGSYLKARLEKVKHLLEDTKNSFWTDQYSNKANPEGQRKITAELLDQLSNKLDYLFVGTGTGGTITGCLNEIQARRLATVIVPVDVYGSKVFNAPTGNKKIPGIGAGQKSSFFSTGDLGEPVYINDEQIIEGCWKLLRREAILAGGSTGAVVSAIEKTLMKIPTKSSIAFFISDRGERYLDTIYSKKWVLENFQLEF